VSARTARWLAPLLASVTVAMMALWAALLLLNVHDGLHGDAFRLIGLPLNGVGGLVFVGTGLLIATRRPENPIGWLLMLFALVSAIGDVATQYASAALLGGHGLPGGLAVAVSLKGGWVPGMFLLFLIVLLFPTGALLSTRWRAIVWVGVASMGTLFVLSHLAALDDPFSKIDNPLGVDAGPVVSAVVVAVVFAPAILWILGSLAAAFACPVVRFRRATGDEREQLKWFFLAAAALPMGLAVHLVAETFFPSAVDEVERGTGIAIMLIAIAIAIAILKYRLYEIDRIISRTLVYGGLTVVLGAVYIGLVLAGQALFSSFAGGSNLAIAASTLAVAALFLPVRSRVQRFVDRRFYRRRYNAQRTLEGFGARLREQVDLETLEDDLRSAVVETMQPAQVSVWLRTGARG
jgi:hypothetical protein